MKMNDYVGRHVVLARSVVTRGGERFGAGEVFRVYGHWRGRLNLTTVRSPKREMTGVGRGDVVLVEAAD